MLIIISKKLEFYLSNSHRKRLLKSVFVLLLFSVFYLNMPVIPVFSAINKKSPVEQKSAIQGKCEAASAKKLQLQLERKQKIEAKKFAADIKKEKILKVREKLKQECQQKIAKKQAAAEQKKQEALAKKKQFEQERQQKIAEKQAAAKPKK